MKKAIITGGSGTLGTEISKILIEKGISIVDISTSKPEFECFHIETDLTDNSSVSKAVEEINSQHKDADILVNCAGIFHVNKLEELPFEVIDKVMSVNINGIMKITAKMLPIIKKNKGDIINIVSSAGLAGKYPDEAAYSSSKWAERGFTELLQTELKETPVRVLGIYPVGFKSKLFEKANVNMNMSEFMDPEKIAGLIVYLLELPKNIQVSQINIDRNI